MFVLPKVSTFLLTQLWCACNSRPLQLVTSYKYLGVFLDNRLSWEAQILHTTRKVSQKIGALLRAGQQLTLPAKRLFYMAIIAADIEYGSNAFYSSLSTTSKEKLIRLLTRGQSFISLSLPNLTSVTALVQSLLSLLAHFCGTLCRLLCRLLCGIPMLISLDLGTPLPLTWDSLYLGTPSLLGFQIKNITQ